MTRSNDVSGEPTPSALRVDDWRGWIEEELALGDDPRLSIAAKPEAPALPAMLRRRLDATGRAACQALAELELPIDAPLIFASRHGASSLTLNIIQELAKQMPASPAQFSMSVHNAVLGVYSIALGHHGPIQAIAASGQEIDALFIDALGYLSEGHRVVGAVFCDSRLTPLHHELIPGPVAACAVAMRLTLDRGRALSSSSTSTPLEASPVELLRFMLGRDDQVTAQRRWHWSRRA
ncbi:beta-ketoacyl synthase chain length factor [Halotalea alkalilenta]|uniref:Beta-ketoacyl synthase-like N-terminal domain-containing protein n=1 Tax=Halotalea alkalilenta TaxID=376489 RepID=A0A172YCW0_9GAMM|nr:beta-ketoacyl synthase chain length factor [Halotalea alkalilenta]ANF57053.1 hypothetical protein A5892_05880 [Halotalea alkalilenta]